MLGDLWDTISGWLGDTLSSLLESVLNATLFKLLYYIERILCWIVGILYQMFEIFAGLVRVEYDGKADYLINIFFSNRAVSNIYWGMALIGIALTFGFAIFAVVRKVFDAAGKQQQSLGQIIFGGIRSIFIILGMTAIMSVVLNGTGVLLQQVNYLFNDPYNLNLPVERTFTGEEYAAMGRVLSTIGNYSVVESRENRYNLNLCFNDIRSDMYYLQQQGIFDRSYYDEDQDGNEVQSWQSILAQIATSNDLRQDVKVDVYNDSVVRSILAAMEYLDNNARPTPLEKFTRSAVKDSGAHLDRMIFLMGTFRAAKNSKYNTDPAINDALRGRYYYDEGRSIYNFDHVESDFQIGFQTDYIIVWIACLAVIWDLVVIILNCIARIFNMLFLYLIAPPIIAAQPLDNGAKTKQWMTAFLVQSLSVFGTIIAMRLLLVFLPMIVSPQLVLIRNSAILNAFAKFILVYGGFEAAKKSSSILTGILADSAGWQAVQAGDMSSSAGKAIGAATGLAKGVAGKALGAAKGVASFAAKPVTNTVSRPFKAAANWWTNLGTGKKSESGGGGGGGGGGSSGGGGGGSSGGGSSMQPTNIASGSSGSGSSGSGSSGSGSSGSGSSGSGSSAPVNNAAGNNTPSNNTPSNHAPANNAAGNNASGGPPAPAQRPPVIPQNLNQ